MNILVGKCGVQIKFGYVDISLGDALYMNLFKAYPQHNFYVITHNNLEKVEHPSNVHYVPREIFKGHDVKDYKWDILNYIQNGDWKDIHFDMAFIVHSSGINMSCSYTNFGYIARQCEPGWFVIGRLGIPYIMMCDDAAAFAKEKVPIGVPMDVHPPMVIISQMNNEYEWREIVDKDTLVTRIKNGEKWRDIKKENPEIKTTKVKVIYGQCEKIPLLEK